MCNCDKLASDYAFVYRRPYARHSGSSYQPGGRPRKTPLFDYSSTMAKEKPQGQGLVRNDFRAPRARDKEPDGEARSGEARKRERERGAKNEVKFIRVHKRM